ncbi:M20/M25/M40 family metallo-hydrolase [Smaragdicoccus niigatensis]|uniref:M20/M25/M40 family metallo-hydrolase n=1 Tax=Smaragdicoccus niigatensis TaxID=359359 RepID=UPI00037EC622|nr:M20/M25/M40 family metallo-hydrolase [Smaragdicoccus niigatensis]
MTIEFDHLDLAVADLASAVREFRASGYLLVKRDLGPLRGGTAGIACAGNSRIVLSGPGTVAASALRVVSRTLGNDFTGIRRAVFRVKDLSRYVDRLEEAGIGVSKSGKTITPDDPALPVLTQASAKSGPATTISVTRLTLVSPDLDRTLTGLDAIFGEPDVDGRWRIGLTTLTAERGSVVSIRARLNAARIPAFAAGLGLSIPSDDVDHEAAERLGEALRIATVSHDELTKRAEAPFHRLGAYLEEQFPRVHRELDWSTFGPSRLYCWKGESEHVGAILLAHQDVVPVDNADLWSHPPFSGVVDDEFVWGRGAIDDKSRVLAILEAIEDLLRRGFHPKTTIYFAFGHDEEVGGHEGAQVMAQYLATQNVSADFVLDEGGIVSVGMVDGISPPVASIMLGEKGFATLRLDATDPGGHSSMPPERTAVGRIAQAIARIQDNPLPLRVTPPVLDMVRRMGPHMPGPVRAVLASAERFPKPIAKLLSLKPHTAALVRTTFAPTVIRGGVKENVLPQSAEAFINVRILAGDTIDSVVEHCIKVVDDERVRIGVTSGFAADPSPSTDPNSPLFDMISEVVQETVPAALITSGLVPGATDSRHYSAVAQARFNFTPILLDRADLERIHGTDERISLANYKRIIDFNVRLLQRL